MKMVIAFVLGVMVGSVVTLMLAPKSGEELRQELRQQAAAEREQARKEYAQAMEQVHQRVDKVQSDMHEKLAQVKTKENDTTETAVAPAE